MNWKSGLLAVFAFWAMIVVAILIAMFLASHPHSVAVALTVLLGFAFIGFSVVIFFRVALDD